MKEKIHPNYYPNARVTCACGNTWTTGSTRETIRTDMCSACHPFFTGEQRIVDTEGQVDRFYKKLEARDQFMAAVAAREASRGSTDQPLEVLQIGERSENVLAKAGITTVAQVLEKLEGGEDALLSLEGFGRKSLIDLKKRLRTKGFLPEEQAAEAEAPAE